jgi:hypothetical protein
MNTGAPLNPPIECTSTKKLSCAFPAAAFHTGSSGSMLSVPNRTAGVFCCFPSWLTSRPTMKQGAPIHTLRPYRRSRSSAGNAFSYATNRSTGTTWYLKSRRSAARR